MDNLDISELLSQWEQNYKKGLLTLWILLSLHERPMYAYEMREKIVSISQGSVSADENSIYRALRRFERAGLIAGELRSSDLGPDRKYFQLTPKGSMLLAKFIQRNILVFQTQPVTSTIQSFLSSIEEERKD